MSKKSNQNPQKDVSFDKPTTWIFDETMGWIDTGAFLSKIKKLSMELGYTSDD